MNAFFTLVTLAAVANVSASSVSQWRPDYGQALAAAKAHQKPLLVLLEDPSQPALRVTPVSSSTDPLQADLLRSYELCRVNVNTVYGQRVAAAFQATQFPYVAVIDKTGSVILFQTAGQLSPDEWVNTLAAYRTGERPIPVAPESMLPFSFGGANCFT